MVHLIGLKPRVQNVKLVKTIYLPQCFPPVTYSEGIVRKFSNVASGICISVPLFFSVTTKEVQQVESLEKKLFVQRHTASGQQSHDSAQIYCV